jgi:AraC family transcriptional regulator
VWYVSGSPQQIPDGGFGSGRTMSSRVPARTEWKALQTVQAQTSADVLLASPEGDWEGIAVTRFRLGRMDVELPPLGVPTFGINYGQPFNLERTLHGQTVTGSTAPGQLAILPLDAPTRWVFDRTGEVVIVTLSRQALDNAIAEGSGRDPRSAEIVPRFLIRDLELERVAHQLLKEVCEPGAETVLKVDTLARGMAEHLVTAHSNVATKATMQRHAIAPGRLRRAQEFIRSNLARQMTLQEIADNAGVSVFHFARSFKRATGLPPHQYLTEMRLVEACALLRNRSLPIGQVAKAVGFTHSHFTAVFIRRLGMTPTEFRDVLDG